MLDTIARGIASLARASSRRPLAFARDASGNLSARDGEFSYAVVRDAGDHRRRLHTAILRDGHGRRGYLRRTRGEAACAMACEAAAAAAASAAGGSHLAAVTCEIRLSGKAVQVPCVLALSRTSEGLGIELLHHAGAVHLVRPAFVPNLLSGTLSNVGFRAGSETVGNIVDIAALITACVEAPGMLDAAERADAGWGVVMATVLAATGGGRDSERDRRSVEILREHDRVIGRGEDCPDVLAGLAARAARHLTGRHAVWSAVERLPQAAGIAGLVRELDQGLGTPHP